MVLRRNVLNTIPKDKQIERILRRFLISTNLRVEFSPSEYSNHRDHENRMLLSLANGDGALRVVQAHLSVPSLGR